MTDDAQPKKARTLFLFIMLVLCTLLHGISVADSYIPAVIKTLSVLGLVFKQH